MKIDLNYSEHHRIIIKFAKEVWGNSDKRAMDYVRSIDHYIHKFFLQYLNRDIGSLYDKSIEELQEHYDEMENNEKIRNIEIFKRGSIYRRAIECYIGARKLFMVESMALSKEQKKAIIRDCKAVEGNTKTSTSIKYERNAKNRIRCIEHYGLKCYVCGFDFEKEYGKVGKNFIEVHHIIPLSKYKEEHEVNPIRDLRPVCSNCHSMLHRTKDCLDIEKFKREYKKLHKI